MSQPTTPVSGNLSAASPSPIGAQPAGSAVSITPRQVEQQALVIVSGTYTGLQLAAEAQDPEQIAPWYGVRATPQNTGSPVWGGTPIVVPDNPAGTNPAFALICAIEAAGSFRARCLALGSGTPAVAILVGSFFGNSPVPAVLGSGVPQQLALLRVLRSLENLIARQSGGWVGIGTDDGSGNTITPNPALGDGIG